ncbi:glycosyltransferase family 2 protein [Hanstruepera ponticola]|uniref:glycosyltransferase family 2 protein n=1 Tax=Hanstruepera ponticola TaxID=2042995 RepID=UPI00177F376B|nr:glycosyltransferase [Hanstruepera ponticola]
MLSILIPTYNYNAYPLAEKLVTQSLVLGINFELSCMDDGSNSNLNTENQKINTLECAEFIISEKNVGRTATRQILAQNAKYDWLLFLDADVMPKDNTFIKKIVSNIENDTDIIFGGITYQKTKPEAIKILRWHYGRNREQQPLKHRKNKPYQSIISGALAIKKDVFLKTNSELTENKYGLDILFSTLLKKNKTNVVHIENPVIHFGIENNKLFLSKTKKAIDTLYYLVKENKISSSETKLLKVFNKLRAIGLAYFLGTITLKFNNEIEKKLLSKSPNLILFDIYRLGYFCRLNQKDNV